MTEAEQVFLLRVARLVVGRHGLLMRFEKVRAGTWRIEAGSHYGPMACVEVTVTGPYSGTTASGRRGAVCTNDVAQGLRAKLRRMARS